MWSSQPDTEAAREDDRGELAVVSALCREWGVVRSRSIAMNLIVMVPADELLLCTRLKQVTPDTRFVFKLVCRHV
jgi:hypothetical protein